MAEFADVMKQAARMCKAYGGECRKCPADDSKHHICMICPEAVEYRYSTPEQADQIEALAAEIEAVLSKLEKATRERDAAENGGEER